MSQTMVPDWGRILDELAAAGVAMDAIAQAMGTQISHRMLRWYRDGAQPAYWRGKGLIDLWGSHVGQPVPLTELRRGYRAQGQYTLDAGPRAQSLPKWPPAAPVAVAPVKRKAGRPRKVQEAV